MILLRDTYTRRDYKGLIEQLREYANEYEVGTPTGDCFMDAAEAIEELEDEVADWKAYGKWIQHPGGKFVGFPCVHYECDQCHEYEPVRSDFCPHCGARMEK